MSAYRRRFGYQLSELEHELIATAARAHNCLPRDLIVRAVAAFSPPSVDDVKRARAAAQGEIRALNEIVMQRVDRLTPREVQVLHLIAEGLSNKLIGVRLFVSDSTAKYHVNQIMKKMGASTRTGAVTEAMRRGMLAIEPARAVA